MSTPALPRSESCYGCHGTVSAFGRTGLPALAALLTGIALQAAAPPVHAQDVPATAKLAAVLPRAAEERLALSAAPPHLRDGATVYVYGDGGFEQVRAGTNGFTCLVNRDSFSYEAALFKPTCWDAHGATTYVPVMLKVGEMLAHGASAAAIRRAIDEGFADGSFRAPTTGGIAYMLAGDVEVDTATGEVTRQAFPGHYMLYAVGATNEQLGFTRDAAARDRTLPSVFAGGAGGEHGLSYIILVPDHAHATER